MWNKVMTDNNILMAKHALRISKKDPKKFKELRKELELRWVMI